MSWRGALRYGLDITLNGKSRCYGPAFRRPGHHLKVKKMRYLVVTLFAALVTLLQTGTAGADCRQVAHAKGEACVTRMPKRIVVLDTGELDIALALGVVPTGATVPDALGYRPGYLPPAQSDIMSVGTIQQPNLEAIAALKPDLILGSVLRHGPLYTQLSRIAPTVFSEKIGASWKDNLTLFADALGRSERAEAILAAYNRRLDALRAQLSQGGKLPQVSVVRSLPDHVRVYLRDSFIGSIIEDAGLPRPEHQRDRGFAIRLRSPDAIDLLDGDIVFVTYYGAKPASMLSDWRKGPFWPLLDAVQSDRVHDVADGSWMLGLGPIAAMKVVDDLELLLADG